jgi:hypothetical protein
MPDRVAVISISSNNSLLEKVLIEHEIHPDLKFTQHFSGENGYTLFIIDLHRDLSHVSQSLIEAYGHCLQQNNKLLVVLLHGDKIDTEKNHYFQKMLDDLGGDKPLHRLVFTKDLYQYLEASPVTVFDQKIVDAIINSKINISRKGENVLYPLSLNDFVYALAKIFFLAGTSGKTFWLLGDPFTDLEFAYLLKNNLDTVTANFEINALELDDPQTVSLRNLTSKSKAELNWEVNDDFSDKLISVINLSREKSDLSFPLSPPKNIFTKILTRYREIRHPQKKDRHLDLGQIIKKVGLAIVGVYLLIGIIFVFALGFSLQQLALSAKNELNGNPQTSVDSLHTSVTALSIGESSFSFFQPILNLVAPVYTQKIYNLFSFVNYSQSSLENLQQTYTLAENLLSSLNNSNAITDYTDVSLALHSNLSQIYENINQISYLSSDSRLPTFLGNELKKRPEFQNLKTLEDQVVQFIKISDLFPSLLSGDGAKNILVLLQNSHILQPSGGEIDYFLMLTLDHGQLISQKYYTPADLQVLYQSTASAVPKNKKNSASVIPDPLTLNDFPDFSVASQNISAYIDNTLKIKPDFIIAVNDLLFEQLLTEEKSSDLDSFKTNYVGDAGQTKIKDLSSDYLSRLFGHQLSLPVIGRVLAKEVGDNQLYLWSADSSTEKLFSTQSYSGIITPHPCHTGLSAGTECLAETGYLSESQNASSRHDPWSSRQVSHSLTPNNFSITHEYQINYVPDSVSTASASVSTVYDLYLSTPSTLDQVYLDDLPYSVKQVVKSNSSTLDHYQIPMELSLGQNHKVLLRLTTQTSSTFANPISYSFTEYRQPGTVDSGITLKINYPESMRVSVLTEPVTTAATSFDLVLPAHTTTFGFSLVPKTQ